MKVTILLHGPASGNIVPQIINALDVFCNDKRNEEFQITLFMIIYEADREYAAAWEAKCSYCSFETGIVYIKDLFNPGFYNINRQIWSVRHGLEITANDQFVIKLRNDQLVEFEKLFSLLNELQFFKTGGWKFLTTNCYTRKDRLYHPSDMFLCGWQKDLLDYYQAPLMKETSAEWKMYLLHIIEENAEKFEKYFLCPESYLFTNYLKQIGWELKRTAEDSYEAIKKFFYVANTWDINLRWNKARVPGTAKGSLILPMWGKCAPFAWDTPIRDKFGNEYYENVCCYERQDFHQSPSKEDEYYISESKYLYMWAGMPSPEIYKFPLNKVRKGDRIVLYGAGNIGKIIYHQVLENRFVHIISWLDKAYRSLVAQGCQCKAPSTVKSIDYDWILIAVENQSMAEQIRRELIDEGADSQKILWSNQW